MLTNEPTSILKLDRMMENSRRRINKTSTLPLQNEYTLALNNELSHVAFSEERAPENKGLWRQRVFSVLNEIPLDLEIGTGTGTFFAHQAALQSSRMLIGIELKYKPLVQSIRRALKQGSKNAAMIRYHAFNLDELFAEQELNDVYIHFPDPWVAPRKPQNRVVSQPILDLLYERQRPGSALNFKTDSREYFLWSMEEIKKTKYRIEFQTLNLHQSEWASKNFITGFESIFMKQGIEINFVRLIKD